MYNCSFVREYTSEVIIHCVSNLLSSGLRKNVCVFMCKRTKSEKVKKQRQQTQATGDSDEGVQNTLHFFWNLS